MKIKVCGLREPENIRAVAELGIDMMGFVFCDKSPRNVQQLHIPAGTIPDCCSLSNINTYGGESGVELVGVFVDEMPQNVITRVYNYHVGYIQLNGKESTVYIDNLRRSLVPDIAPDIKIIKTISVNNVDDIERWHEYEGHVDMLLFDIHCQSVDEDNKQTDWSVLDNYEGNIPFILSGDIEPDSAELIKQFHHSMCIGININENFEDSPAVKNIDKLKSFIAKVRA